MKKIIINKKILLSWIWVSICSIGIFLTVPVARKIQKFVYENWRREVFIYFVVLVLALGILALLYFLIFRLKIRALSPYIWLLIVGGLYGYFSWQLREIPEETIHFLEYGLLGFFLFRALSHTIKDKSIYITATLFAFLIGIFDETLQWMMPRRYWGFRDIGLNGLSGGLILLTIWKVIQPKNIKEKFKNNSLKILSSIFAICLIILGLCISNTPKRVYSYTNKIPFFSFLQKEEPMSEFGYKYKDPEIGSFKSRLNPEKLERVDRLQGKQYAKILDESRKKNYEEFLREYNPIANPFLYELRIHIFRRDTYLSKGKSSPNSDEKEEFHFISYKENLILEKYFTNSIISSSYRWNENIIQETGTIIDKTKPYNSPVSAELITIFSESTMWIFIFTFIFFLMLINSIPYLTKKYKT